MPSERPEHAVVTVAGQAMGTRFEIVLAGADPSRLRAAGENALDEIRHWHQRLSWFDRGSFISHLNANAAARAVECDPEFFELVVLCRDVWRDSGGAFDPTVAALMRASGFRDLIRDEDAIAESRAATGFDKVEIDEARRTVRFARAGVGLDLGAVGKGWALDRANQVLREAGVTCGLLHGGTSSVVAIGAPPRPPGGDSSRDGWPVAIEGDEAAASDRLVIVMKDVALGVSAPGGRVVEERAEVPGHASEWRATDAGSAGSATVAHGHVLDPRTGRSARGAGLAAVVSASCAWADAWSTAVLVEGARPAGMPGDLTSVVLARDAGEVGPARWRIAGPDAATLIRSFSE